MSEDEGYGGKWGREGQGGGNKSVAGVGQAEKMMFEERAE